MPEYLTVKELAELLRIKERKVYDLASSGAVPCTKVTGKLLFPEAEVRAWIAGGRSGPAAVGAARPEVFLGSHDPLLDWALRQSRAGLATYFDSSMDGLRRFVAGEGVAAGLHLIGPESDWNIHEVSRAAAGCNAVLIGFARRRRGLLSRADAAAPVTGLTDLRGRRVVPRQADAGSERLFQHCLAEAGVAADEIDFTAVVRSEDDAAFAVKHGEADAAFGLEALAASHDLAFAPVIEERFDLLLDRRAAFEPALQTFLAFLRSADFAAHAAQLAGYDVAEAGEVRWNA